MNQLKNGPGPDNELKCIKPVTYVSEINYKYSLLCNIFFFFLMKSLKILYTQYIYKKTNKIL